MYSNTLLRVTVVLIVIVIVNVVLIVVQTLVSMRTLHVHFVQVLACMLHNVRCYYIDHNENYVDTVHCMCM